MHTEGSDAKHISSLPLVAAPSHLPLHRGPCGKLDATNETVVHLAWEHSGSESEFPTGGVEGELFLNTWLLLLKTKASQFRRRVLAAERFGQQCFSKSMTAPVVSLNVLARARLILGMLSSVGQAVRHAMLEEVCPAINGRVIKTRLGQAGCWRATATCYFEILQLLGPLKPFVPHGSPRAKISSRNRSRS